ncbi:PREDICTED: uncharacterized protein LOC105112258 [Populus euphratica]|uniref:Uncharacterized protein LOC105112258 n=1 Tax=Populus euphratica TaxID=75702 RepID=A0AAJ6X580_POPEU|nr:PREDICTED: uncharacterized protein LOC105112258 [Populus euphratica]
MLSFCCLSLCNIRQPSPLAGLSWLPNKKTTPVVSLWLAPVYGKGFKRTSKDQSYFVPSFIVHAVEKDSEKYEIDSDKAKEALQKLDQQLQAFSEKQISSPKIRASDVKLTRDEMTEEVPEVSGSVLVYTAAALFLFTIFYNIFFLTVLQPSVDGPLPKPEPETIQEITATTMEREPPKEAILQLLPLMSEVLIQSSGGGNN